MPMNQKLTTKVEELWDDGCADVKDIARILLLSESRVREILRLHWRKTHPRGPYPWDLNERHNACY